MPHLANRGMPADPAASRENCRLLTRHERNPRRISPWADHRPEPPGSKGRGLRRSGAPAMPRGAAGYRRGEHPTADCPEPFPPFASLLFSSRRAAVPAGPRRSGWIGRARRCETGAAGSPVGNQARYPRPSTTGTVVPHRLSRSFALQRVQQSYYSKRTFACQALEDRFQGIFLEGAGGEK
jgi:hypothetical protein